MLRKVNLRKSPATARFDQLSQQRIDFSALPGGGQRARLTVTLAGHSRPFTFVEDMSARDVAAYGQQVSGIERVGAFDFKKLTSGGIQAVAKKVATSKVLQTAAAGLAMIAPALGPLAPMALGVSGGIGVAGKLLGAKNAAAAGAPMAALSITQSAISDAQRLSPDAFPSLLAIANDKANSVQQLVGGAASLLPALRPASSASAPRATPAALASSMLSRARASTGRPAAAAASPAYAYAPPAMPGSDAMQLVAAGRVRSDRSGPVTAAQLEAARMSGRLFFVS